MFAVILGGYTEQILYVLMSAEEMKEDVMAAQKIGARMTDYDRIVQTAQFSDEELPVLINCLAYVANADGVFSSEEHAFLCGIVESFTDSPELAEAFVDSAVSLPESVNISHPEVAVLLSYMLAYIDGCFSKHEAQAIESLTSRLGVSNERCSELHLLVKKKLYNMVLFNIYEDMQKTADEQKLLDELRAVLNIGEEDANEEERRVCKELEELANA